MFSNEYLIGVDTAKSKPSKVSREQGSELPFLVTDLPRSKRFAKFRRNPAKNPASFEVVRIAAAAPVLAKAKEEAEAYEMERRDVLLVASLLCAPFRAIYLVDHPGKK